MSVKSVSHYLKLPYTIILRQDEDGDVVARIDELPGCTTHGKNPSDALDNLREVQELWISERIESGQPVPEPTPEEVLPSGKWVQRVPKSLHKKLSGLAKTEGVSLNQLVTSMLAEAVGMKAHATGQAEMSKEDLWPALRFSAQESEVSSWRLPRTCIRSSAGTRSASIAILNAIGKRTKLSRLSTANTERHDYEEEFVR